MGEKGYLLLLGADARLRDHHRTEKGRVIKFLVQLEIELEGVWREVIRYDTAHAFAHIDRFSIRGDRRKELLRLGYREALLKAEEDLKGNWLVYRERFLAGELP